MKDVEKIREYIRAKFIKLQFDERRHLYFEANIGHLPSVSSKVEHFIKPFDEALWLPRCARKEKMTEHELKHKWQTINQQAKDLGTTTHDFLEKFNGVQTPTTPQEQAGIKFLKSLSGKYRILFRELRMYSKRLRYAGTADLILLDISTGKIVIADYKTNGDLFKDFGYLKSPFDYLENHPYNHYQIQLSYYQMLLEDIDLEVSERQIIYLQADAQYKVFDTYNFTNVLKSELKVAA